MLSLAGKIIKTGSLGNSPHKFAWYNRTHEEFTRLTKGKTIGEARAKGRWLFIPLEPGYNFIRLAHFVHKICGVLNPGHFIEWKMEMDLLYKTGG